MTTISTQINTVIANPISGDYRIDVLLEDASYRWNHTSPFGTGVQVTYSFMRAAPNYADSSDAFGFTEFTLSQRTAVREILSTISQLSGISFLEVNDSDTSYGKMRFGNNAQGDISAGYAYMPAPFGGQNAGDLYINNQSPENLSNVTKGTYAYATLVHEIGHILGLKHPGNYNAGEGPSTEPGNYLAASEDTEANTIMSYIQAPQGQVREFFGAYDVLALQYLYGKRLHNTGDNVYRYSTLTGENLVLISDSGGVDTIDVSAVGIGASVSLKEGGFSSIGKIGRSAAENNVSIAFGVVVENVTGTAYADAITGNAYANTFRPGKGNDVIEGLQGFDTVFMSGARNNFTVSKTAAGFAVNDTTGSEGLDTINGIERVKFDDNAIAFDIDGNAGKAYRLYQAAFDRKPDLPGLGFWIKSLDDGNGLLNAANGFYGSDEFKERYGATPTNIDLLTRYYQNMLDRAPDADGFNFWLAALDLKVASPVQVLVEFSESLEFQDTLVKIGTFDNGIEYIPYFG